MFPPSNIRAFSDIILGMQAFFKKLFRKAAKELYVVCMYKERAVRLTPVLIITEATTKSSVLNLRRRITISKDLRLHFNVTFTQVLTRSCINIQEVLP